MDVQALEPFLEGKGKTGCRYLLQVGRKCTDSGCAVVAGWADEDESQGPRQGWQSWYCNRAREKISEEVLVLVVLQLIRAGVVLYRIESRKGSWTEGRRREGREWRGCEWTKPTKGWMREGEFG